MLEGLKAPVLSHVCYVVSRFFSARTFEASFVKASCPTGRHHLETECGLDGDVTTYWVDALY